jgi:thiosulfate/3-mercaptopyruvate sulfurtransferase
MECAGIKPDTTVVFYGAPVQYGTYAWWVMKLLGHADVRMLDGGKIKWELEGRATTTDVPEIVRTTYVNGKRNNAIRAGRDDVLNKLGDHRTIILDHRSDEEYSGARVCIPGKPDVGAERNGRVPGARHVPFETLLNEGTTFKSRGDLHRILQDHVSDPAQPIISYCRLAHRATLAFFAMTELLGFENVRVYDGSWTEWGSIVGVPIER